MRTSLKVLGGLVGGANKTPGGVLNALLMEDGIFGIMLENDDAILLERAQPGWVITSGANIPVLDIDFVNNRAYNAPFSVSIASLLTCTRASTGYYTWADGTLTSFAVDTLRYGTN